MSNYDKYGLSSNPFVSEKHDYPLVGMKSLIAEMQLSFTNVLKAQGAFFYVLFGRYGDGKTRLLFELTNLLEDSNFSGGARVLTSKYPVKAMPPKPPSKYFASYLFPQIVKGIGLANFNRLREELENVAYSHKKTTASLLEGLDADFCNAFLAVGGAEQTSGWAWLRGQSLTAGLRKRINVTGNLNSEERARTALLDLLKLLWIVGYKGLVLPIDEFEYMMFRKGRAIEFVETYRDLYDAVNEELTVHKNLASLIILLACTPDAWDTLKGMRTAGSEPFLDRIPEENKFTLAPLNTDETRQFIEGRLNAHRVPAAKMGRIEPFEDDYPEYICEKSGGRPRGIRIYSRVVLDDALFLKKGSISTELTEGILLDRGYIVKPIPTEKRPEEIPKAKKPARPRVERRVVHG